MYLLVEANADRGRGLHHRGDSGREARPCEDLVDEDDRMMDESGEWAEASESDVASIAANDLPVGRSGALRLVMSPARLSSQD